MTASLKNVLQSVRTWRHARLDVSSGVWIWLGCSRVDLPLWVTARQEKKKKKSDSDFKRESPAVIDEQYVKHLSFELRDVSVIKSQVRRVARTLSWLQVTRFYRRSRVKLHPGCSDWLLPIPRTDRCPAQTCRHTTHSQTTKTTHTQ